MGMNEVIDAVKGFGVVFRRRPGAHIQLSRKNGKLQADVVLVQVTDLPSFPGEDMGPEDLVRCICQDLYHNYAMPENAEISVSGQCRVCKRVDGDDVLFSLPDLCVECEDGMGLRDDAETDDGDEADARMEAHVSGGNGERE